MDSTVLTALVIVLAAFLVARGVQLWPSYSGTIYQELFSSFLEYFWRMRFKHDLSASSYLKSRIGNHRIVYNAAIGKKGAKLADFITVFSEHGFVSICSLPYSGNISSATGNGKWKVTQQGKTVRISSTLVLIAQQKQFLRKTLGDKVPVKYVIAFGNGSVFEHISSPVPVRTAKEAVEDLCDMREGGIGPDEVAEAFGLFREACIND